MGAGVGGRLGLKPESPHARAALASLRTTRAAHPKSGEAMGVSGSTATTYGVYIYMRWIRHVYKVWKALGKPYCFIILFPDRHFVLYRKVCGSPTFSRAALYLHSAHVSS